MKCNTVIGALKSIPVIEFSRLNKLAEQLEPLHGRNDFAEVSKNLAKNTDLKLILLLKVIM